jgi:hypothetical protein
MFLPTNCPGQFLESRLSHLCNEVNNALNLPVPTISSDLDMLHRIVWAEARGEDERGQVLVVNVIMNRVKDVGFPGTIRGVIFEPDQFTPVRDGSFERATPTQAIRNAVDKALNGVDHSRGALFFRTIKGNEGSWHETALTRLFDHGNHRFYTDRAVPMKSIDEIAREVILGRWGNGQERIDRLTAAGYVPAVVQARVNEILRG